MNLRGQLGSLPNQLTAARLVSAPVLAAAMAAGAGAGGGLWRPVAAAVFVAAMVTDAADGVIARRWGLVTRFGQLVDPIADKVVVGVAVAGLAVVGPVPWAVVGVMVGRDVVVTVARLVRPSAAVAAGVWGKVKTVVQCVGVGLGFVAWCGGLGWSGLWGVAVAVLWGAAVVGVWSGGVAVLQVVGHGSRVPGADK